MLLRAKQAVDGAGLSQAAKAAALLNASLAQPAAATKVPAWVFLGPPGVGKGTYASRVADTLGVPHISAGDLVRSEMKAASHYGRKMAAIVNSGNLLPDSIILEVLHERLSQGRQRGEEGYLLDGFPRTRRQAESLSDFTDVQLALNLHLDEQILIAKCLGRRICAHCSKNYNVADINIPATAGRNEIVLPPLQPPPECEKFMERRADDTLDVIKKRLQVHNAEASPVEDYFREQGVLVNFEILGGIPETMPRLLATLQPFRDFRQHHHAMVGDATAASPQMRMQSPVQALAQAA